MITINLLKIKNHLTKIGNTRDKYLLISLMNKPNNFCRIQIKRRKLTNLSTHLNLIIKMKNVVLIRLVQQMSVIFSFY